MCMPMTIRLFHSFWWTQISAYPLDFFHSQLAVPLLQPSIYSRSKRSHVSRMDGCKHLRYIYTAAKRPEGFCTTAERLCAWPETSWQLQTLFPMSSSCYRAVLIVLLLSLLRRFWFLIEAVEIKPVRPIPPNYTVHMYEEIVSIVNRRREWVDRLLVFRDRVPDNNTLVKQQWSVFSSRLTHSLSSFVSAVLSTKVILLSCSFQSMLLICTDGRLALYIICF